MRKRNRLLIQILSKVRLKTNNEFAQATIENIREGVEISGHSLWVLAAAIFIASLGLNINSTAVIIGAMLVSPIMGPIMGIGLGLGINDMPLVNKSFKNYVVAVFISLLASTAYFFVSPVKIAGSELLSRTSPTMYDVLIALFGGLAGIIAGSSKLSKSNVIPGVAIATALMPPLCTVGFGIANLNMQYVIGAIYLFFINSVFISLATYFIVRLLNYPQVDIPESAQNRRIKLFIWSIVILTIIPSIYLTYHIVNKYVFERTATEFIRNEISKDPGHFVVSRRLEYDYGNTLIELTMLGVEIDSAYKTTIRKKLNEYDLVQTKLNLIRAGENVNTDKGFYDQINSGVEVNAGSIQDLYSRLDSLQREIQHLTLMDTMYKSVAAEAKLQVAELDRFSILPQVAYNYVKGSKDTSYQVIVSFTHKPSAAKINNFQHWLAQRLNKVDYKLSIE